MKNEAQLTIPAAETALATRAEPSVAAMLNAVIEQGVTEQTVSVLKELIALKRAVDKDAAEKEFARAFVVAQAEMPIIVASTAILNRGKYERFEDVMRQVGPVMKAHGFAVAFTQINENARITETCHLMHTCGVTRSNSFTVRVSGKADSETQADSKASTTAKRNALLNAWNIVIRQDVFQDEEQDASLEGSPIDFSQAQTLQELVKETGSDEAKFLAFAGAKSYDEIMSGRYAELWNMLNRKPRK